jgi:hypothetical protein
MNEPASRPAPTAPTIVKTVFRIVALLVEARFRRTSRRALPGELEIGGPGFDVCRHHEAASKFLGQNECSAKYSAAASIFWIDCRDTMRFNEPGGYLLRAKLMKKLILAIVLAASQVLSLPAASLSALAQTRLTPKAATAHTDNCAPIGRTANGELVYSMKCENLPAPPPQAELKQAAPPPEPEVRRSGLFGMSYEVKRPDQ